MLKVRSAVHVLSDSPCLILTEHIRAKGRGALRRAADICGAGVPALDGGPRAADAHG